MYFVRSFFAQKLLRRRYVPRRVYTCLGHQSVATDVRAAASSCFWFLLLRACGWLVRGGWSSCSTARPPPRPVFHRPRAQEERGARRARGHQRRARSTAPHQRACTIIRRAEAASASSSAAITPMHPRHCP